MRKLSIILSPTVLLLLAAGPVYGQWTTLKGQIPFDFSVGNKNLPADTYSLKKGASPSDALTIYSKTDGSIFLPRILKVSSMVEPKGRLVFRKYGDQHFLAEVWGINDTSF